MIACDAAFIEYLYYLIRGNELAIESAHRISHCLWNIGTRTTEAVDSRRHTEAEIENQLLIAVCSLTRWI